MQCRTAHSRVAPALLFLALAPGAVFAQAPRQVTLGPATAAHAEPFGLVTVVRELSNGRVVVADPLGGEVTILSADLKTAQKVGREGSGPGEYRQPDAAWPFPGDSTIIVDLGNTRLTILSPAGTFARSTPMMLGAFNPGAGGGLPPIVMPGGIDAQGKIYFLRTSMGADSGDVTKFDPATGKTEVLGRTKLPESQTQTSGSANNRQTNTRQIPLSGADGWGVAPNGSIVLIRQSDYHLEWIGPSGARRTGKPVTFERVRIGSAEKEEWIDRQQLVGGIGIQVQAENGRVSMSLSRGRADNRPSAADYTWPVQKPPFDPGTVRVDPLGRVWVMRHQKAGEAPLYDVFGSDGNLVGSVRVPVGRRVAGFGTGGLYAAAVDDDGQHRVERYAMPL
ncbi:MAG: hypothetical protein HOP28_14140 [Gemmatimonadales bacterium]|nr:hypothetical protein [Gemmatimonadales bacterium]